MCVPELEKEVRSFFFFFFFPWSKSEDANHFVERRRALLSIKVQYQDKKGRVERGSWAMDEGLKNGCRHMVLLQPEGLLVTASAPYPTPSETSAAAFLPSCKGSRIGTSYTHEKMCSRALES